MIRLDDQGIEMMDGQVYNHSNKKFYSRMADGVGGFVTLASNFDPAALQKQGRALPVAMARATAADGTESIRIRGPTGETQISQKNSVFSIDGKKVTNPNLLKTIQSFFNSSVPKTLSLDENQNTTLTAGGKTIGFGKDERRLTSSAQDGSRTTYDTAVFNENNIHLLNLKTTFDSAAGEIETRIEVSKNIGLKKYQGSWFNISGRLNEGRGGCGHIKENGKQKRRDI